MDGLKESKQAVGAATLAAVNNLAPPTILAQASRLNFSTRLFNLIVTNVPGPQVPLYVLGRKLEDLFPIAFLPENHALAIAIMSYNGGIDYGLLGDYDALPDIDVVAAGIDERAAGAARDRQGRAARRPPASRALALINTSREDRRDARRRPGRLGRTRDRARRRRGADAAAAERAGQDRSGRRHARQAQPAAFAAP